MTEHRPVADTLRAMKKGAVEHFPLTQYNSLRNAKLTTLVSDIADGADWEIKVNREDKRVDVTRMS